MTHSSSKQRRTPTTRGAVTRQRIIAVAAKLVLAKGARGASLEDIMSEAEVSKSQLYHYFADKEAIIEAVVRYQTTEVIEAHLPYLRRIDSMPALCRWRDALLAINRVRGGKCGCPLGALASELADASESARIALVGSFDSWATHIERGLNTMKARGELSADAEPKALATAMLAAVQGGLLLSKTTRTEEPLAFALDMAIAHVERFTTRNNRVDSRKRAMFRRRIA